MFFPPLKLDNKWWSCWGGLAAVGWVDVRFFRLFLRTLVCEAGLYRDMLRFGVGFRQPSADAKQDLVIWETFKYVPRDAITTRATP